MSDATVSAEAVSAAENATTEKANTENASTASPGPTIALLGLGTMGLPMARNIAAAGLGLRVWNRSEDKAAALAETGARIAGDVEDAVAGAGIVVTMLYDADAAADVLRQANGGFAPGAVWVQMGTVGVAGAERLAQLAEELGLAYVDAPVMGTRRPAEEGNLVVLASGPDEWQARLAPLFDVVARRTLWVGPAGNGSRLKLVANAWVLAMIEGIAESINLAEGLGLDPTLFLGALEGGAMDAPYVSSKGLMMISGEFTPAAFSVSGALKDAELIVDAASTAAVRMEVTEVARRSLMSASAAGHGGEDMAAIFLADRGEENLLGLLR